MIIEILKSFWPKNKAKGLVAQSTFLNEIDKGTFGNDASEKIMPGCWLLAPKSPDFFKFRFCFFIHPSVMVADALDDDLGAVLGGKFRPFHAISEFMNCSGIGVVYAIPATADGQLPLKKIKEKEFKVIDWQFFSFENGRFVRRNPTEFFSRWKGDRGRPSYGTEWDDATREKMEALSKETLTELLLNELFYTGFVKYTLKKPLNDPYDVDSFLISISQKHIFPMEIKEKFPGEGGDGKFFGIDAGRIMMLLRLCLPNDANGIYLIREVKKNGSFVGWKYLTLADIVMNSSWNLQAGGPGMGGQSTQTVRLPYSFFRNFNRDELNENNLKKIGSLPKDIKVIAGQFGEELSSRFNL